MDTSQQQVRRLERFLLISVEDGSTFSTKDEVNQERLFREGLDCVKKLITGGHGGKVMDTIVYFSANNLAPKKECIIFVLALCARQLDDDKTKSEAYKALPQICRSSPNFFLFIHYCEQLSKRCFKGSGWGRAHRNGVNAWYLQFKDKPLELAKHVTKCPRRHGFSHQDVIRLSHIKTNHLALNVVLRYVARGIDEARRLFVMSKNQDRLAADVLDYLDVVQKIKTMDQPGRENVRDACEIIERHGLMWEQVANTLFKHREIWRALLPHMPLKAMLFKLSTMTRCDVFEYTNELQHVKRRLTNEEEMKNAYIRPYDILKTWLVYKSGKGEGSVWRAHVEVVNALEVAYNKSLRSWFRPNPDRSVCLAVDMTNLAQTSVESDAEGTITGITSAAHIFLMVIRTWPNNQLFNIKPDGVEPIDIPKDANFDKTTTILQKHATTRHHSQNLSQPIEHAIKCAEKYDAFIHLTSGNDTPVTKTTSTNAGDALINYRKTLNMPRTKLLSVALAGQSWLLEARLGDPDMLDIQGFDSCTSALIQQFMVS